MGTKILPNPIGETCIHWEPIDETPTHLYVLFWDIVKGDMGGAFEPPNGHIFKLTQTELQNCVWESLNAAFGWKVLLGIQVAQTWIDLQDTVHANNHYFGRTLDISPPPEYTTFTNWYAHPFGNWGYDGFAVTFWLERVREIVLEFGFDHLLDLMLEVLPVDTASIIHKFCSKELVANVKIKESI